MTFRLFATSLAALSLVLAAATIRAAEKSDDAVTASVRKSAQQVAEAFNAGKADQVSGMFLPAGEMIDEVGTIYQGPEEIRSLLDAFFGQFPGAKLTLNIESIRLVGPVAIEEGTRSMATADGEEKSRFRYIAVWAKADNAWKLASFRDFSENPLPTPNDYLQPIAWLVGDWINEGTDGKVSISYCWSEDKNYLLGDFNVNAAQGPSRKTTQRIGWDPAQGKIRSWLFDSDGGFAEGTWTIFDDGIVIKSSSVNPDGTTATATMDITRKDDDHYVIEGTDRIVGDNLEDDFEITITRRPPAASK